MVLTHIKKIRHSMPCVTGLYFIDIVNMVFFNVALDGKSSEHLLFFLSCGAVFGIKENPINSGHTLFYSSQEAEERAGYSQTEAEQDSQDEQDEVLARRAGNKQSLLALVTDTVR